MKAAIALLWTRPDFRRLWLGNVTSQLGDWIGWVAVAMVALRHGGGPLDLAAVFAAHHLPAAALSPVSGVLADRIDRRTILWASSLVLGVLTVGMAVAAGAGEVGVLQLLLLVRSAGVAFFTPAERAALPSVVRKDELLRAGALDAATWSIVFSFGMAAGGLLTMLGPTLALSIDAATFVVSAVCFARLPSMRPGGDRQTSARPSMWRGIGDAVRYSWPRPALRRAVFAKPALAIASGAAWMALAIQADRLGGVALGGVGFGLLHAVRGVGTGVGPVIAAAKAKGGPPIGLWRSLMWVGMAGIVVFGFSANVWLLAVAAFAWGVGNGTNWVVSTEQIQRLTPDRILARISALDQTALILSMTLGAVGVAVAHTAGARLGLATLAFTVPAAVAWWLLDRATIPETMRQPQPLLVADAEVEAVLADIDVDGRVGVRE